MLHLSGKETGQLPDAKGRPGRNQFAVDGLEEFLGEDFRDRGAELAHQI